MSTTYTSIPVKQISTNFGTVNKVIWFDVTGITGTFAVNLFITPNQSTDINIVILILKLKVPTVDFEIKL